MDREALKRSAQSRRNRGDVEVKEKPLTWDCTYCSRAFLSERVFMNHKCRERERLEQLKGPVGQAAYSYYSEWMRLSKRSVPGIDRFAASSLYSTFIKFAEWAAKVRLPNANAFIRAMVENGNIQPSLWCRDNTYALYLQSYDSFVTPTQQFVSSIEEVLALASELKCEPKDVFEKIGVNLLLDLVQKRKISPWFLISSSQFRRWWAGLGPVEATQVEEAVRIGALALRISNSEALKNMFAEFIAGAAEVGL